ncbi:hypothetical protein GGR50DRAFT_239569 [Xylaria sp. CBS 124048]|nr:hypothetical protein GGR50DRAFT_239569 [Xylaria sp. CBS 124048]
MARWAIATKIRQFSRRAALHSLSLIRRYGPSFLGEFGTDLPMAPFTFCRISASIASEDLPSDALCTIHIQFHSNPLVQLAWQFPDTQATQATQATRLAILRVTPHVFNNAAHLHYLLFKRYCARYDRDTVSGVRHSPSTRSGVWRIQDGCYYWHLGYSGQSAAAHRSVHMLSRSLPSFFSGIPRGPNPNLTGQLNLANYPGG